MAKAKAAKPQQNQKESSFTRKTNPHGKKNGRALRLKHEEAKRLKAVENFTDPRTMQAQAAAKSGVMSQLKLDAPKAHEIALAILSLFPTVRFTAPESRTTAAIRVMRVQRGLGDPRSNVDQADAERTARAALQIGFEAVRRPTP